MHLLMGNTKREIHFHSLPASPTSFSSNFLLHTCDFFLIVVKNVFIKQNNLDIPTEKQILT